MAVRIRMKRFGRKNRPFYRVCAIDSRRGRDGRVIEELGHYDPLVPEVDARAILNGDRITYWMSVGALPSDRVNVLVKKYGQNGTHRQAQQDALGRLAVSKPKAPPPQKVALPEKLVASAVEEGPPAEAASG